jgi:hypothetical protein
MITHVIERTSHPHSLASVRFPSIVRGLVFQLSNSLSQLVRRSPAIPTSLDDTAHDHNTALQEAFAQSPSVDLLDGAQAHMVSKSTHPMGMGDVELARTAYGAQPSVRWTGALWSQCCYRGAHRKMRSGHIRLPDTSLM